jgi:O-succinylbenzoate synthase
MPRVIERIGLAHLRVPFKETYRTESGEVHFKDAILVALETADGLVAVGECSPAPEPDSGAPLARCWGELAARIVPDLLGREVEQAEDLAGLASAWAGCHPSAVAGAETACWDLVGQRSHQSLSELLGAPEARIEVGVESGLAVGLFPNVVDLLRAIEPHLAEGYPRLTLAIAPGRDVEFVEAIQQHHPELLLAIDAGALFGREHAEVFRRLDEFQPLMIARPYPVDDLDGLAALQKELTTPIALEATAVGAIRRGACRMARLSIQGAGGFGPARALHDLCRDHGVACWVSTAPELGVGLGQAIHLATLPNCKDPSDIAPSARWFVDDVLVSPIEHHAPGRFRVCTRPGLGHRLDPRKVKHHQARGEEWSAVRTSR